MLMTPNKATTVYNYIKKTCRKYTNTEKKYFVCVCIHNQDKGWEIPFTLISSLSLV